VRREVALPAGVALAALSVAFLTKSLLSYADWILNRGLAPGDVGSIAALEIVPVLAQTIPFALLIGVLVGLGRLKADLELLAMETLGFARLQLVRPVLAVAVLGWLLAAFLSVWAAPSSRAALEETFDRIQRTSPGALLQAGTVNEFADRQLLVREVSPDGTELHGVLLWMPDLGEAVFGERGRVSAESSETLHLHLDEAALLGSPAADAGGQHVEVASFDTTLELGPPEELPGDRVQALSTLDLARSSETAPPVGSPRRRLAELHRRLAHPSAALVLGVLAAPLALGRRRFSRSSGAVAGLLLTGAYYGLVQLGEALLRSPGVPVAAAIWLAPCVVAVLAGFLLFRLSRFRFDEDVSLRRAEGSSETARPIGLRGVLDRYVLGVYGGSAALSMAALFLAYFLIDVLERLDWFAKHRAELGEILHFYSARAPLLISRVIPMGLLAGSALTVSLLALRNELVAMQASGIRLARALLPVLVLSALVVPVDFWLNDAVVTRTNAWADRIKVERIKDRATGSATQAWYRAGGQLVRASQAGLAGGRVPDLIVYELGSSGLPAARIHAREARRIDGEVDGAGDSVWELVDAEAILISERGLRVVEPPLRYALGAARRAEIDPMHHSADSLAGEIAVAQASGFSVVGLQIELHRKLAQPFACLLLPSIALLLAVRTRRPPSAARNLVSCAAVGVTYLLFGDIAASLGLGGQISPVAAGWAPPALAMIGAGALLTRPRS
jgi:LPS export ABC transporter permease LptF/LPS export ABC transporter permease LptG